MRCLGSPSVSKQQRLLLGSRKVPRAHGPAPRRGDAECLSNKGPFLAEQEPWLLGTTAFSLLPAREQSFLWLCDNNSKGGEPAMDLGWRPTDNLALQGGQLPFWVSQSLGQGKGTREKKTEPQIQVPLSPEGAGSGQWMWMGFCSCCPLLLCFPRSSCSGWLSWLSRGTSSVGSGSEIPLTLEPQLPAPPFQPGEVWRRSGEAKCSLWGGAKGQSKGGAESGPTPADVTVGPRPAARTLCPTFTALILLPGL